MTVLRTTIFGGIKYKPNTFIGGVSGTLYSRDLLAERLNISDTKVKAFKVLASDVQCNVINNYVLSRSDSANIFPNTLSHFIDKDNLVKAIGNGSFMNMTNLEIFEAYGIKNFTNGGGSKLTNTKVSELYFPAITDGFDGSNYAGFGNNTFQNNLELKRLLIPNANIPQIYSGNGWITNSPKMELIDMRKTKIFGRITPSRGSIFDNVGSALIPGILKAHQDCTYVVADSGPDVNMMKLYNKGWEIQLYNDLGVHVGNFSI